MKSTSPTCYYDLSVVDSKQLALPIVSIDSQNGTRGVGGGKMGRALLGSIVWLVNLHNLTTQMLGGGVGGWKLCLDKATLCHRTLATKACGLNSINDFKRSPIYEQYVVKCESKIGHQTYMFLKEIELRRVGISRSIFIGHLCLSSVWILKRHMPKTDWTMYMLKFC